MAIPFNKLAFSMPIGAAVLMVANQLLGLAAPYLVKVAIDDGIGAGDMELLWMVGLAGLFIYAAIALTSYGGNWLAVKAGEEIWEELRNQVFAHVQDLPLKELKGRQVGELVAWVYGDTYQIKQVVTAAMPSAINLVVSVGGAGVILLILAPQLVFLALLPIPIGIVVLRWHRKFVRPLSRERMDRYGKFYSILHEGIAGAEDVRVLGAESEIASQVRERGRELKEVDLSLARYRAWMAPGADFGISLVLLGTLVAGGHLAITGTLSVGVVVVFYFYVSRCLGPIRGIPSMVFAWHSAQAARERIDELLAMQNEVIEPETPRAALPGPLEVEFRELSFSYGPGGEALDGFGLDVSPGASIAILGPSGVGKSTTARLLMRLMDGTSGQLRLGGENLREWSLGELRRRIGYVGQEVFLFGGTLRANLVLGLKEDPEQERIQEVLETAGLKDLVEKDRGGLEMEIGPRGANLSGGQKKRVALARALLRSPDLLIVDQMATDLEESLNERIFRRLRHEGMTLLYFGHRVPAGLDPSEVYWMERGQVRPYLPGQFEQAAPL